MRSRVAELTEQLAAGKRVLIDGATGTELERRGAQMHPRVWCATATLTHPNLVREVHEDYIRAGARVITANTFSSSRNMLTPAGLAEQFENLVNGSVALAMHARDRVGEERVVVAGSMSHQMPLVPGTDQRDASFRPDLKGAAENFREMAETLAEAGVDLLLLEMMSDPELAVPAIEAAHATGLPVWVGYSCVARGDGAPVSRRAPELSVCEMLAAIPPGNAGVIGIMHSSIELTTAALEELAQCWDGPLMAYPDSGHFEMPHWQFVDVISPDAFSIAAAAWMADRVQVIGGCCGLGLEHIQALAAQPEIARNP